MNLNLNRETVDVIRSLYGNETMLSIVKAWKYSAPDNEFEKELDMILKVAERRKA